MSRTNLEYEPTDEDLCHLREWIKKTPYVVQDYDDEFLGAIVRKCKGSLQKTKTLLENLNSLGARYPEYFGHLDIFNDVLQEHLHTVNFCFLPKRTEDGSLISVLSVTTEDHDLYKFRVSEGQRYMLLCFYVLVWEKIFGSGKVIMILDWSKMSALHGREVTPVFLKNSADIMVENFPFRIQAIHHVNVPSFLGWIINSFKSFLKKNKIIERIHVHSSMESLHNHLPVKLLPKEYGGNEDTLISLHNEWKKKIESYRERLVDESIKMRSLDSIRPRTNDIDDMVGTFKALKVD